jgi:hypothetical protein
MNDGGYGARKKAHQMRFNGSKPGTLRSDGMLGFLCLKMQMNLFLVTKKPYIGGILDESQSF